LPILKYQVKDIFIIKYTYSKTKCYIKSNKKIPRWWWSICPSASEYQPNSCYV